MSAATVSLLLSASQKGQFTVPAKNSRHPLRKKQFAPPPKPPHTYDWWLWTGPPTFAGACDALAAQYAILDELIQPLLTGGWRAAPQPGRRRGAIRLAQLTAVAEEVVTVTQQAPVPATGLDAVDWYRRRSADGADAPEIVTQLDAARVIRAKVADLAARHRTASAVALAVLRSGEPDLPLGGAAAGADLAEFTMTRLAAAVIHGLDLAEALGRPGHADPTATNLVSGFLAAVAERGGGTGPASAPISVDGQGALITLTAGRRRARIPAIEWIQAATGRRPAVPLLPRSHAWLAAELPLVA